MKRRYRLLKRVDFKSVLSRGDRTFSRCFVCYHMDSGSVENVKIGIIIPKKKCKLSNKRKYLKRLFWALNTRRELDLFPRIKCVVMYRDFFYSKFFENKVNFEDLKREYMWLMRRITSKVN